MRHLLLAVACVPLGYGMPEDNLKLEGRAGVLRVTGQVMIRGHSVGCHTDNAKVEQLMIGPTRPTTRPVGYPLG